MQIKIIALELRPKDYLKTTRKMDDYFNASLETSLDFIKGPIFKLLDYSLLVFRKTVNYRLFAQPHYPSRNRNR